MRRFTKHGYSKKKSGYLHSSCFRQTFMRTFTMLFCIVILFAGCKKNNLSVASGPAQTAGSNLTTNTATGDEFTIVAMPDTQWYMEGRDTLWFNDANHALGYDLPGTHAMFDAQIDWIKANAVSENIVYVAGLGDIVDGGDISSYHDIGLPNTSEWDLAKYYYNLETSFSGHPHGIPYGLSVGNHDQTGHGWSLTIPPYPFTHTPTTSLYNQYFGISHFTPHSVANGGYYGGSYTTQENNNDNHFDLFTAGGINFIVIYLEYDDGVTSDGVHHHQYGTLLENWAYNLLTTTYASRKAIIVTHALTLPNPTANTNYGAKPALYTKALDTYNRLKSLPNVFLMLGGHTGGYPQSGSTEGIEGEGYRQDTYNGHTIRSITSNYQWRQYGGDGLMRVMKFSVIKDQISIKTYSPYSNTYETDGDSQFNTSMFRESSTSKTNDYVAGGKSQIAVYYGNWKFIGKADNAYGTTTDIPVPGDFNGDGATEQNYYNPTTFRWYLSNMDNITYGTTGDIPVPGDYNGDGRTDVAMWRPSNFTWYLNSLGPNTVWGTTGDIPVPADYDGDGKTDLAVWRPSTGQWYVYGQTTATYGQSGDIPVPGDYDGTGITVRSVFRRSNHSWYVAGHSAFNFTNYVTGDIPVPGDYDGDGKTDMALYRPSTGQWYLNNVLQATTIAGATTNYKPVNLPYSIRKFFFP